MRRYVPLLLGLVVLGSAVRTPAAERSTPGDLWKAEGTQGIVAAGGGEAADAALEMLKTGGNAADAAVAAMLVLSVTDPANFCFGGEVPVLVFDARRNVVEVVCGQGVAPRLATIEYFQRQKQGKIP
jgi:gamma-glutamyltranspeptidase/glutathione hydrolase